MAGVTASNVLSLYRKLLREGMNFSHYNYREFAVRRVRDYFKEKKSLTSQEAILKEYLYGMDSLALLHRQVTIGRLYTHNKLVVESVRSH